MLIGKRITELRKSKSMTLTELAQKSGVQIATLSRIENLKMTGTLESHMAIASALGTDITQLYSALPVSRSGPSLPDQTPESRKLGTESFTYNDKASYEILVNKLLSKKMMPVILKIEKGGRTNSEQSPAGSERFIFILEGKVLAVIGEHTYPLPKNSSLYFDASIKHHFENRGQSTTKMISVITPVML